MNKFEAKERIKKRYKRLLITHRVIFVSLMIWIMVRNRLLENNALLNFEVGFVLLVFLILISYKLWSYEKALGVVRENNILPPTDVIFEKTNNVNENIRRYKKAQRKAVEKTVSERKKASWFKSLWL